MLPAGLEAAAQPIAAVLPFGRRPVRRAVDFDRQTTVAELEQVARRQVAAPFEVAEDRVGVEVQLRLHHVDEDEIRDVGLALLERGKGERRHAFDDERGRLGLEDVVEAGLGRLREHVRLRVRGHAEQSGGLKRVAQVREQRAEQVAGRSHEDADDRIAGGGLRVAPGDVGAAALYPVDQALLHEIRQNAVDGRVADAVERRKIGRRADRHVRLELAAADLRDEVVAEPFDGALLAECRGFAFHTHVLVMASSRPL